MRERSTASVNGGARVGNTRPWPLPPEDWRRAKHANANVMLVGPGGSTAGFLEDLRQDLQQPVVTWHAGERFSPPTGDCVIGTMILRGVEAMAPADQQRLYQWLHRRGAETQILSMASQPLLPLVDEGAFHDGLYYRLNTVCVEVDTPPASEYPVGGADALAAGGRSDRWVPDESDGGSNDDLADAGPNGQWPGAADSWTLRIKPDRRRSQATIPGGLDRRGR